MFWYCDSWFRLGIFPIFIIMDIKYLKQAQYKCGKVPGLKIPLSRTIVLLIGTDACVGFGPQNRFDDEFQARWINEQFAALREHRFSNIYKESSGFGPFKHTTWIVDSDVESTHQQVHSEKWESWKKSMHSFYLSLNNKSQTSYADPIKTRIVKQAIQETEEYQNRVYICRYYLIPFETLAINLIHPNSVMHSKRNKRLVCHWFGFNVFFFGSEELLRTLDSMLMTIGGNGSSAEWVSIQWCRKVRIRSPYSSDDCFMGSTKVAESRPKKLRGSDMCCFYSTE